MMIDIKGKQSSEGVKNGPESVGRGFVASLLTSPVRLQCPWEGLARHSGLV